MRIKGIEEDDPAGRPVRRLLQTPKSGGGNRAREADCADGRAQRIAEDAQCRFGKAIPGPVTVKIDHESDVPVVEQFGLSGKGNRAHVRCKRVAQSTRSRKHGANSHRSRKREALRFEPDILRQQLWKVVAGLEEKALELGGGIEGEQVRFARCLLANNIVGNQTIRRLWRTVVVAFRRRERYQADANIARRRNGELERVIRGRYQLRDIVDVRVFERECDYGISTGGKVLDDRVAGAVDVAVE